MEHGARGAIATFFAADEALAAGATVALGESVARHARSLRLGPGSPLRLVDGAGHRASARLLRLARESATVEIMAVEDVATPPAVHLLVPVGDRERMLWLAEKATELGATSWRPVVWRRSRSVRPRGEGPTFASRLRARMISALEQSAGACLPATFPEASLDRAIAASPAGARLLLDPHGGPMLGAGLRAPVSIAVGPEGGIEPPEHDQLTAAGFLPVSLGSAILRFETAAMAALAVVRAALAASTPSADGH